jgi:hypothetical protein
MIVFLDFEASSLARHSYPIEVAWVFEDSRCETHLIRPAPNWTDWDEQAEAIHHIPLERLKQEGMAHDALARHMVTELSGHDLTATAPSWDGKWLSALLRAAGLPRHSLRLRDTEEVQRETARAILEGCMAPDAVAAEVERLIADAAAGREHDPPAHRALADARAEHERWLAIRSAAERRKADQREHFAHRFESDTMSLP